MIIARGNYRGSLILEKSVILEAQDSRPLSRGNRGSDSYRAHRTRNPSRPHSSCTTHWPHCRRRARRTRHGPLCRRWGNSDGIQVTSSKSNARLVQSTVTSSDDVGIRVAAGASASLVEAEITRNGTGIALAGARFNPKKHAIAYNETGLLVSGPGDCTVEGGFLWSNTTVGLHLDQSTRAKFLGVTIRAPGGVPGVTISRNSRGQFDQCTVSGTPMEADHQ